MWYGVWVDVQVGERSEVLKSMRALGVSGSRDSGVWGFPILRECLVIRSRGTSATQGWRWCRYLRGSVGVGVGLVMRYCVGVRMPILLEEPR